MLDKADNVESERNYLCQLMGVEQIESKRAIAIGLRSISRNAKVKYNGCDRHSIRNGE
jgi:hypothetical protein